MAINMRKIKDFSIRMLIYICAAFSVILLALIILYVLVKGISAVNWSFLTSVTSVLKGTVGIAGNIVNTILIIFGIIRRYTYIRYPLWHVTGLRMNHCVQTDKCRAAIWYTKEALISDCVLHGIKAVRECADIAIRNCDIISPEFGWMCANVTMENTSCEGEYFLLHTDGIRLNNVRLNGKYSFQYVKNVTVADSVLDTKDAFWHAENVKVKNCTVKGEYLGWYSDGLTLINCKIIGTQPFCYCRNLRLINCEMEETDLAFEYSDVTALIRGHIESVKNPRHGVIVADSIGEIIRSDSVMECDCEIVINDSEAGL